jgi:hypothetical protein
MPGKIEIALDRDSDESLRIFHENEILACCCGFDFPGSPNRSPTPGWNRPPSPVGSLANEPNRLKRCLSPFTYVSPFTYSPRQEYQIGRFLGIPEKRLARRAYQRTHGQATSKINELACADGHRKVGRDFARADRVPGKKGQASFPARSRGNR